MNLVFEVCYLCFVTDKLFSNYIDDQDYQANWSPVSYLDESHKPGMRGGHQMCIDHLHGKLHTCLLVCY